MSIVKSLSERLQLKHAEKVIAPAEIQAFQHEWGKAEIETKLQIIESLDSIPEDASRRFLQLMTRQPNGVSTLIAIRSTLFKAKLSLPLATGLTETITANLDSGLQVQRMRKDSPRHIIDLFSSSDRVHPIASECRMIRRLEEVDRRVFYLAHFQNPAHPLIVVNVALTQGVASSIQKILDDDEKESGPDSAIFYSISSLEPGLRGIDLGHRLITSATAEMQNDVSLTNVTQFSSLSPVPGFRRWILKMMDSDQSALVETIGAENYSDFRELVASLDPQLLPKFSNSLPKLLFKYLFAEKGPDNSTVCPVCNFHVRNGAELWRLNFSANTAQYGMSESLSMMVNYRYYTDKMWQNSYDYQVQKIIPISDSVRSTFLEK